MGDKTKLGFVPETKIVSTVGAKLWAEHQKNAAALNAAREKVQESKDQVRGQIAKALKIDPTNLDFHINGKGDLIVVRRAEERRGRTSDLADLTAAQ